MLLSLVRNWNAGEAAYSAPAQEWRMYPFPGTKSSGLSKI